MLQQPSFFSHVILTRFNLRYKGRGSKKLQSKDWLQERFELFEKYCLPSVVNQTNKNFFWFIFFDIDTPEIFKKRAQQYANQYPSIKLFWVESAPLPFIKKNILESIPDTITTLITTRLDNDDAINKNFIAHLHNYAQTSGPHSSPKVLNFDNGLCFKNNNTYYHQDRSNAFTSLIEPLNNEIQTIWRYQHTQLNHFPIIQLSEQSMWLQVIHGRNISNRVRGYRIKNDLLSKEFTIKLSSTISESGVMIFLENISIYPLRFIKEFIRMHLKKILLIIKK